MSKFCIYCGMQLSENDKFCSGCGKPVQTNEKKNSASAVLPIVLAIILIVQLTTIILFGKPGILIGDKTTINKTAMSETAMDNRAEADKDAFDFAGSSMGNTVGATNERVSENVKADATFDELFGIWTGEIELTKMDGFAEMAKMQGGPDVSQEIEEMLSTPTAVELEIEDTGEWSFDMNVGMGMDMDSDMFKVREGDPTQIEGNPLISGLNSGCFEVNVGMEQEGQGSMKLHFTGALCEENGAQYIEGVFEVTATMNGMDICQAGNYRVNKE